MRKCSIWRANGNASFTILLKRKFLKTWLKIEIDFPIANLENALTEYWVFKESLCKEARKLNSGIEKRILVESNDILLLANERFVKKICGGQLRNTAVTQ